MMKYLFFLLFILFVFRTERLKSQEKDNVSKIKISIASHKKKLKDVLIEIEQKTNIIFSYNTRKINADSLVSISVSNGKLEDVFRILFSKNIAYQISSNNVILFPKTGKSIKNTESLSSKTISEQSKFKESNCRDTVWIYRTDTIIVQKVDTIKIIRIDTIIKKQFVPDPEGKKKRGKSEFSAGVFYQIQKPNSSYNHFGIDQEDIDLGKLIRASEKMVNSQRMGFMFFSLLNHLELGAGISLLQLKETYSYKFNKAYYSYINNVDTIEPLDTIAYLTGENKYYYVSIPISVGYSYHITDKIDIGASVYCWINYLFLSDGKFLDIGLPRPYNYKDINSSSFSRINFDISFHTSMVYNITDNVSVLLSPSYAIQIGSDYSRNYPITKSKKSFGIIFSFLRRF